MGLAIGGITCQVHSRGYSSMPPGLHGDAAWESRFLGSVPDSGGPPTRTRLGPDLLNRTRSLAEVAQG